MQADNSKGPAAAEAALCEKGKQGGESKMNCLTCGIKDLSFPGVINHLEKKHLITYEDGEDVEGINIQIELFKASGEWPR